MMEWKEILVPIDFSETSKKAVEPAYSLAARLGGKVILLHVIDMYPKANPLYAHYTPDAAMSEAQLSKMRADFEARLKQLVPSDEVFRSIPTEVLVVGHPSPAEAVVEQARKTGSDVIVLTHKGWSTLAHIFIGSTAERVVRHAPCPVMLLRR